MLHVREGCSCALTNRTPVKLTAWQIPQRIPTQNSHHVARAIYYLAYRTIEKKSLTYVKVKLL